MKWYLSRRSCAPILGASLCLAGGCQAPPSIAGRPVASLESRAAPARHTAEENVARGRALEKCGDIDQAVAAYEAALANDPRQADACWRLAVLHDRQGQYEASAEFYRKALAARPGNADVYCDMGYSLYLQQRWPEAEMNYRQALALARDHRRAHNNLGVLLARTNRVEEALVEFRIARCDVADAHINVAYAMALEGHWEEARRHYERALAVDESSDAAMRGLRELKVLHARVASGHTGDTASERMIQLTSQTTAVAADADAQVTLPPRDGPR